MAYRSLAEIPPGWEAYRSDATLVRNALSKVTTDLITRLPDGALVTVMEANGVVTRMESREISGQPNPVERNRTLLRYLKQKDARTILQFFAVLKTNRDLAGYNELVESFMNILRDLKHDAVVGKDLDYYPSVGQLPLLRLLERKIQFLRFDQSVLEEYNAILRELSGALFSLSPAKLKQVAQWIEQLVVHSEDCKGMTRLSSRLPPSCLSAKYLLCFICQATSPLDISVAREVCEVLQHRKLEKSIRSFAKHQPILDGKSLAEFPVEVTPINSSGDFCHITVDIPGNPHDVKLWLVREIHDSFMKNMKTSIIIFQGYQRTELTSSNICTLFFLIPSRIASNLLKEVDSVLAKLPVCGILRIGIMDTSHHSELGFVQDKKIAHCDLGVWKGESVDSWDPMHAERERMLTLKALLADKEEMLEIRRREMLILGDGRYSSVEDELREPMLKAYELRSECDKLEKLCKFLQERLDEVMYQENSLSAKDKCNGGSEARQPMEQEVWYRNDIPHEDESRILQSCPVGAFIVRSSQSFHDFHTLVVRQESGVRKFAIQRVKGICGISDVLQFASVQDMVHFFTLHSFEIGVKLKPMNVTEHYQLQQLPNGSTPHEAHSCSQPETMEDALATIEELRRQLNQSHVVAVDCSFNDEAT